MNVKVSENVSWVRNSRTCVKIAWDRQYYNRLCLPNILFTLLPGKPSLCSTVLSPAQSCALREITQASSQGSSECSKLTKGVPESLPFFALVIWCNSWHSMQFEPMKWGIVYWRTSRKDFLTFRKKYEGKTVPSLDIVLSGYNAWCCCTCFVTRSEISLSTEIINKKMEAWKERKSPGLWWYCLSAELTILWTILFLTFVNEIKYLYI